MFDNGFCNDCELLRPKEKDQLRHQPHMCGKYNKQVYHLRDHPKIHRCLECLNDNPVQVVIHSPRYSHASESLAITTAMLMALNSGNQ